MYQIKDLRNCVTSGKLYERILYFVICYEIMQAGQFNTANGTKFWQLTNSFQRAMSTG